MLNCRRCTNWVDESFTQLQQDQAQATTAPSLFYGCRIYGVVESFELVECPDYREAEELFQLCTRCGIAVPKVCLSLGECVNCTDTDLFCVEHCRGEGEKKYCTHFQRLTHNGHTLIEDNRCFELYPQSSVKPGQRVHPNQVISIESAKPKSRKS